MVSYSVGQIVENFIGHEECTKFDMDDSGATLYVFFQKPDQKEIEQFKAGNNFEIRFTELQNIIFITVKIGSLNWMDAPYSTHLSPNLTSFHFPNEGQGLGLTVMLIDACSGEIKAIRFMGLSEKFTAKLFGVMMEDKVKPFNESEYRNNIRKVFAKYNTNQIVRMSTDYCKIRD